MQPQRIIGIRHRVKKTKDGEARPTQVAILIGDKVQKYDLETETDELDWALGRFPTKLRAPEDEEELSGIMPHHIKWRDLKKAKDGEPGEDPLSFPRKLVKQAGKDWQLVTKVPAAYDGFRAGDLVAMALGGSGDRLSYALSRQGETIGAEVIRLTPKHLKAERGANDMDGDPLLLATLARDKRDLFQTTTPRDRDLIRLSEAWLAREEARMAKQACEQRLRQRVIGKAFIGKDGLYAEGTIEDLYDQAKATDEILDALAAEETRRIRELEEVLSGLDIYNELFSTVKGVGPMIATRLMVAIGDIRRFEGGAPNTERMEALLAEATDHEKRGEFERDLGKIKDRIETMTQTRLAKGLSPEPTRFQILQSVRSWKRDSGLEAEAKLLDRAVECHEERYQLTKQARRSAAKLKAFCGAHVLPDGTFPRRRHGVVANWHPEARQALYLITDQFNRRPDSPWGQKLRENKVKLRAKHPVVECSACGVPFDQCALKKPGYLEEVGATAAAAIKKQTHSQRYTNGHIHKMGLWRTASQFVEWLYGAWWAIEKRHEAAAKAQPQPA